jgi:hypothetical protein
MVNVDDLMKVWDYLREKDKEDLALIIEMLIYDIQDIGSSDDDALSDEECDSVKEFIQIQKNDNFYSLK